MRKDIITEKLILESKGVKMNKTELARQYNCCWETIDRRLNPEKYKHDKKIRVYNSKLDKFKDIIIKKLEIQNVPATGIYMLLKDKYGYDGKYGIVRKFVSKYKKDKIDELTIRFETIKGYQSQVDWKEKLKLHDEFGNEYIVNIFLMVLGYSRYKFIKLTFDKTKSTLYQCLTESFKYFNGTTEEILFDNMKTVVDQTKSSFNQVIINNETDQFSKDAGFKIITCRSFRPRTKGKVETLAKIMNRLKAYDYEFNDINELIEVTKKLNYELNYIEKSQAINEIPKERYTKEKEYLIPVNINLLETYYNKPKLYKVSNESMINYQGKKYSVPPKYLGKMLSIKDDDEFINIYYSMELICSYNKNSNKRFNYKKEDYITILQKSAFDYKTKEEIERFIEHNLNSMDSINIEEKYK